MRNRVLWNSPQVRFPLCLVLLLVMAVAGLSGCGGGGGGGNNNGGNNGGGNNGGGNNNPNLATVSGRVTDNTGTAVSGARVTVFAANGSVAGTGNSGTDGSFSVFNVPLTANKFVVNTPNATLYFDVVQYSGGRPYDTNPNRVGGPCLLPLPALTAGANALPANVIMYSVNSGPPPPPAATCP
jgi:hypothetical protein